MIVGGVLDHRVHRVEHRRVGSLGNADPGLVGDLDAVAGARANAVENRDGFARVVAEHPGPQGVALRGCQLADHGDLLRLGRQWQRPAVVLQQHGGALGSLAGDLTVGGVVQHRLDRGLVDVGVLEQADGELGRQHPPDGLVERFFADQTLLDGLGQVGVGGVVHDHLEVEPGVDAAGGRVGEVTREVLGDQRMHRVGVRDHEALEAERAAQHVGEQPLVARGGHAVEVHVGAHDVGRPGVDGGLERRQVDVPQLRIADLGVFVVAAAAGRAVAGEVLGAGQNALGSEVALEPAHVPGGHRAAQRGVFAVGLDDAAPAGVAGDVDHRRERPLNAHRAGFASGDLLAGLGHPRIPRGGLGQRHRKDGAKAVNDVEAEDHRNAMPVALDGHALQTVGRDGVAHEQQ